jgi:hypothetical protein
VDFNSTPSQRDTRSVLIFTWDVTFYFYTLVRAPCKNYGGIKWAFSTQEQRDEYSCLVYERISNVAPADREFNIILIFHSSRKLIYFKVITLRNLLLTHICSCLRIRWFPVASVLKT